MTPSAEAIVSLLRSAGIESAPAVVAIPGGANNRVYRVEAANERFLLKAYFHDPADRRDRLHAEFAFTTYAWNAGICTVARPVAANRELHLGMYEWRDGRRPLASEIDGDAVTQAVAFYQAINDMSRLEQASLLPLASEACFSLAEHFGTVSRRVDRLVECGAREDANADRAARRFIEHEVRDAWGDVEAAARREAAASGLDVNETVARSAWRVSPSDFGFHNVLRNPDGQLTFVDFEYAGWDDPAKTACDFLCQPQLPVPQVFWRPFLDGILEVAGPNAAVPAARIRVLYPVYRIKWICIMLNEFLPAALARRQFADPAARAERKAEQLQKSVASLARLRSSRDELTAVV